MLQFYTGKFNYYLMRAMSSYHNKKKIQKIVVSLFFIVVFSELIFPFKCFSQKLEFSYSYFNLSRNSGGGTLEQGDTIEVHALVKVNSTTNNFYYLDTIRTGTQYINNSLKLVTNESILFSGSGPFTNTTDDDRGVYDASIPGIRVNIGTGFSNAQSGASFGSTSGGGQVAAGSIPKFYGSTLFVVAYKLLVTANNGDTIHPTGNYYFDTSGVIQTYRFNYSGIKVIQNQALCNNFSSPSFSAESSFGSGSIQNRLASAIVPGYTKINMGANTPADNYYSIANNTSADGTTNNTGPYKPTSNTSRVFGGYWDIVGDHTSSSNQQTGNLPVAPGQMGGYMLVVNAAFTPGEAYRDTIKNVCPNTYYEFSAWERNICGVCGIDQTSTATYTPGVLPNLSYTINNVDFYTTGNLLHDTIWHKRGFIYKTGPSETQFRIAIKNNAAGGGGNDWVLDDIKLATCYPNLVNNPKDTATSCVGISLTLSDTVKSYFDNYTYYCWEKSTNGTTWANTGVCGVKTPSLVNGNWQYAVDTTFIPVQADSGTYYRLKVGTTFSNLNDASCSVSNSQKIFLKVYNVNCNVLQSKILYFNGSIDNNYARLHWASENQSDLQRYEVEKSLNGALFSVAGTIPAVKDANGAQYSFIDPEPVASVVYYRLKLSSALNNENKYSNVIALYNASALLTVKPINPFKNNLKINVFIPGDGETNFYLFDAFGKLVAKKIIWVTKGNTDVIFDKLQNLSAGMYILRTKFDNITVQNKLFKVP